VVHDDRRARRSGIRRPWQDIGGFPFVASSRANAGAALKISEDTLIGLCAMARGRRIFHPTPTIIDTICRSNPRTATTCIDIDVRTPRGTTSIAPRSTATRRKPSISDDSIRPITGCGRQYVYDWTPEKHWAAELDSCPAQYAEGYARLRNPAPRTASSSERSGPTVPGRSGTLTRLRTRSATRSRTAGSSWRSVLRCSRRRLRRRRGAARIRGRRCGHFVFAASCAERGRTTIWEDDLPVVWLTQSEILAVEAP